MTPKKQAEQLFENYFDYSGVSKDNAISMSLYTARKMHYELLDLPRIPYNEKITDHWKMVIYELEKM